MVLSHGNAIVESGFSVNESLLVENLYDESLIAQRIVTDAIKSAGGVLKVTIEKEMIKNTKMAYSRYNQVLEDKRQENIAAVAEEASKKRKAQEMTQLQKDLTSLDDEHRAKRAALELRLESLRK